MVKNNGIPVLVSASIRCPFCKKARECEIESSGDNSIISCEKCQHSWQVTFKSQTKSSLAKLLVALDDIPTIEPLPKEPLLNDKPPTLETIPQIDISIITDGTGDTGGIGDIGGMGRGGL